MLVGVAGGFAEWLDVDPAVVRIVWALLVLAGGAGFLLYILAAIVIPEEPYPGAASAASVLPADPVSADGGDAGSAGSVAPAAPGAPAAPTAEPAWSPRRHDSNGAVLFGGLLVLIGLWFFAKDLLPTFDDRFVLPGILVVVGLVLVLGSMRRR